LQHHQAGNWQQAELLYRQVIHSDSSHADAYHLLGVLATQVGRYDQAIACIRQATALNPFNALYHCNLGAAHEAVGQLEEAVAQYGQALQLKPDYAEAHCNLGNALSSQAKLDEAIEHYRQALRLRVDLVEAHNGLGNALSSQGCLDEAMAHFQQALRLRPDSFEVHNNVANTLLRQGKVDDAIIHYRKTLRIRPDSPEAHNNLGNTLVEQRNIDQALSCYHEALRLRPDFAEARNSLGIAQQQQDRFKEAIASFQEALRLKPNYPAAFTNLGNVYRDLGRLDEALASFEEALRLDPGCAEIHHNRALIWLLQGNWSKGWPEFEWRWQTKDFPRYAIDRPRWDGSSLEGRTLLVLAEQGLGDTLQFIRYMPVIQQDGSRITFACQAPLQCLLAICWRRESIVDQSEGLPEFDCYVPLASLPGILHSTPSTIPTDIPYLHADAELVERWKSTEHGVRCAEADVSSTPHSALRTSHFYIGIAWQGSRAYRNDRHRSIPLRHFTRLAEAPGVQLVSLQKGEGTEQLPTECGVRSGECEVHECFDSAFRTPLLDENTGAFMDTSALLRHLDLVITSDTVVAHLAGALGVPVWVALPFVPDWRWLLQREDSPWYPSMRLFRQTRLGDWDGVFERMAEELKKGVRGQE
jgi:tetratricopeptide (TPR) repeat protein